MHASKISFLLRDNRIPPRVLVDLTIRKPYLNIAAFTLEHFTFYGELARTHKVVKYHKVSDRFYLRLSITHVLPLAIGHAQIVNCGYAYDGEENAGDLHVILIDQRQRCAPDYSRRDSCPKDNGFACFNSDL